MYNRTCMDIDGYMYKNKIKKSHRNYERLSLRVDGT